MSRVNKERLETKATQVLEVVTRNHDILANWEPGQGRTAEYMVGWATAVLEVIAFKATQLLEEIEEVEE